MKEDCVQIVHQTYEVSFEKKAIPRVFLSKSCIISGKKTRDREVKVYIVCVVLFNIFMMYF